MILTGTSWTMWRLPLLCYFKPIRPDSSYLFRQYFRTEWDVWHDTTRLGYVARLGATHGDGWVGGENIN